MKNYCPKEYKIVSLRDCPLPADMLACETPDDAAKYWNLHIATGPNFNPEVETLAVLLLNSRLKIKGHAIVSTGTMDQILFHPRELYRTAIVASAYALVVMHNHPSGDSTPSEVDVRVTRDIIRAGQMLKIEAMDHVVIGRGQRTSLRELGYFYAS